MASIQFDATTIEPAAPAGAWQPGKYTVEITGADVKATKAGDGHYVELELTCTDGVMARRKHWERLNISNPNQQAEEIAKRNLAAICLAVGIKQMNDTDELRGRVLVIETGVRKPPNSDEMQTTVRGYFPAGASVAQMPAPAARPAPAAANAAPWAKAAAR